MGPTNMDRPMGSAGTPPNNYLVPAIISIFCCWPLAIVAIINATQVNTKWGAGDQAGAMASAKNAKTWSTIAIGIGVALLVIYILLIVLGVATSSFSTR